MKTTVVNTLKIALLNIGLSEQEAENQAGKTFACDSQFGTWSNPCAMSIAKDFQTQPKKVAAKIIDSMPPIMGVGVTISGPGFINFKMNSNDFFSF